MLKKIHMKQSLENFVVHTILRRKKWNKAKFEKCAIRFNVFFMIKFHEKICNFEMLLELGYKTDALKCHWLVSNTEAKK